MRQLILCALFLTGVTYADTTIRAELEPLAFLIGSCWEGDYDGKGTMDRHCFTSMFDGAHVRDEHRLIDSPNNYRGETIFSWNGDAREIQFVYWNSLGGVSKGSARAKKDRIEFPDESYVGPDGSLVTVRTSWVPDGEDAYVSLIVEQYENGATREKQVRYEWVGPLED